jgi:hypothetical protein
MLFTIDSKKIDRQETDHYLSQGRAKQMKDP